VSLSPREFRDNLARRFAATYVEDERVAAELRARLPDAAQLIVGALGPRRIVLYGSLATSLFLAAHSDVDLAVTGLGLDAPADLMARLRDLFGRKVDLVDPTLVAPAVKRRIEKEGIVLHEPRRED
jgi:predicted nucleotidyltransferase